MLVLQPAQSPRKNRRPPRIGLAVAGGGPLGGMYERGALRALDEAIADIVMTALEVYVGVSSGALIAADLANQLDITERGRIFISGDSHEAHFRPEAFVRPAVFEYLRRASSAPGMLWRWLSDLASNPFAPHLSDTLLRFGSLLPTGLFDNSAIESFLRNVFTRAGRSNDFRWLAPARRFLRQPRTQGGEGNGDACASRPGCAGSQTAASGHAQAQARAEPWPQAQGAVIAQRILHIATLSLV